MTASSSQRRHGANSTNATGPRDTKPTGSGSRASNSRAQASEARRRLRSTIPPTRYNLWQIGPARTANDASPQADQENLTTPTGYNGLPCDLSRVDRAGTVKPANRGAREVPKHNVTMTKAKDTALAPGRRATENPNMDYPKTPRPGRKRAIRQKNTPAGCPEELTEPPHVLKNQRGTPGRVTTGQEPQNPRHYARSVRAQENGNPGTSEQAPQG